MLICLFLSDSLLHLDILYFKRKCYAEGDEAKISVIDCPNPC